MLRVPKLPCACVGLLVSGSMLGLPLRSLAISEAATEDLLLSRPVGGDPGRMWPGFAAGDVGYDGGPKMPVPSLMVPSSIVPSLTGGDLSSFVSSPNAFGAGGLGSLAGNMMAPALGMMGGIPGSSLSSLMGMLGVANLLGMMPNVAAAMNPQQLLSNLINTGALASMMTQFPQLAGQALNGLFPGFMGLGSMLVQSVSGPSQELANAAQPDPVSEGSFLSGSDNVVSGAQGGVAGSVPYQPPRPSGPANNNSVGDFDTAKAWNTVKTDNAPSNYCGRGVHNILTEQGHSLPTANGEDWNENLAEAGWEKVKISDPSQAPVGGVLVYEDSGMTGTGDGREFGHVEVVSRDPSGNRVYLAGGSSSRPGGSVPQNWDGYVWLPPGS